MGAKYALCIANLFMAKWEEDVVHTDRSPYLAFWARYNSNVLHLWEGTSSQLDEFFSLLNNNDRGIKFTYQASQKEINFLDLTISKRGENFNTISHFEATDRNAFIPLDSCHHDSWLKSVPRSQFIRMRRNCTDLSDYRVQAQILKSRLVEKGYVADSLQDIIEQVGTIDRFSLLRENQEGR